LRYQKTLSKYAPKYAAGEGDVIVAIIVVPTQTFSRTPEFLLFETRLVGCNEKATDLC
jgi:hypothetical protein